MANGNLEDDSRPVTNEERQANREKMHDYHVVKRGRSDYDAAKTENKFFTQMNGDAGLYRTFIFWQLH